MIEALQKAWNIPELRKRVVYLLGMFAIFALGAHIPVPGVSPNLLKNFMTGGAGGLFSLINAFSGGALQRSSIFALGITPYINASIIMQMAGFAFPQIDAMQKEGEAGRKRIAAITRYLTGGLSIIESFGLIVLFRQIGAQFNLWNDVLIVVSLTAGAFFLLWLGEQVTEKGVGNGISLIIFAGIMLSLPQQLLIIANEIKAGTSTLFNLGILIAAFVGTVIFVVYLVQGARRIPVQHNKRVIGMRQTQAGSAFLPIKVNSAGVMPIIFAISLMLLPSTLLSWVKPGSTGLLGWLKQAAMHTTPGQNPIATAFYALLVIGFTYFYTAIVMNVEEMADNLKKYGSYIPGIRPGNATHDYLEGVVSRITLAGAIGLAFIALTQYVVPKLTGFYSFSIIGGTSLLIVVGVAIETMQAIEAQLLMRNYEGFIKGKK